MGEWTVDDFFRLFVGSSVLPREKNIGRSVFFALECDRAQPESNFLMVDDSSKITCFQHGLYVFV